MHLIGNKGKKIKVQTSFCNDCTSKARVWHGGIWCFQSFILLRMRVACAKNEGSMCMHVVHKLSWASLHEIWEEPVTHRSCSSAVWYLKASLDAPSFLKESIVLPCCSPVCTEMQKKF